VTELDATVARQEEWLGGGTVEVTLIAADGARLSSKAVTLPPGERGLAVDLGDITPAGKGELLVKAHVRPARGGLPYQDTIHVSALAAPGRALVLRRGPTSGTEYVPTADLQFRRTERVRLDLPVAGTAGGVSAEVLDRNAKAISIPVRTDTRTERDQTWVSVDTALAPLAPGDYLIRLKMEIGGDGLEVVQGIRVVP
jgi:hypothetical protein